MFCNSAIFRERGIYVFEFSIKTGFQQNRSTTLQE